MGFPGRPHQQVPGALRTREAPLSSLLSSAPSPPEAPCQRSTHLAGARAEWESGGRLTALLSHSRLDGRFIFGLARVFTTTGGRATQLHKPLCHAHMIHFISELILGKNTWERDKVRFIIIQ